MNTEIATNIIEQKANAFVALSDSPSLLLVFCIMLILLSGALIILGIIFKNPNLINNLLNKKRIKEISPNIERRQNKRRKDDLIENACDDCVKVSVQIAQKGIDTISETLKLMTDKIERATINAGLAATGGDLALTDWLRIVFDLWRKGVNGNTVSATKSKIMKEDGIKIWNSELSYNRHKYGEGDKHFQECVDKINKGIY